MMCRIGHIFAAWSTAASLVGAEPVGTAIFQDGAWRFTAVTNRLIRIEYDARWQWVDEPTSAFVRSEAVGTFEQWTSEDPWWVLNTQAVTIRYQRTAPEKGSVILASVDGSFKYVWGDDPAEDNLRGTARTLDLNAETLDLNCHHQVSKKFHNSQMHCTWGLISKAGWAVVDETGAPILRDGWYAPSRNTTDVFVFLHGLDFEGALKDFFHAAGRPALPPRYAFGTLYTRWYNFDSDSTMAMIDEFEEHAMPLDSWIFDMNWHHFGPWGSFSWNRNSYPNLQEMLSEVQSRELFIGANFHEQSGFHTDEEKYPQLCIALGRTPGEDIPFDLYNLTYAMTQENIAVRALETQGEKQGIDFSWIDYQQGETNTFEKTTVPNLNPTIVLNKLRSEGPLRRGENRRSMILSRWGGLGNHRYPVGFSGDQNHTWEGLAFLPYMTSTSANVAFNYWSHDTIGGDHKDHELSVRWTQVSAWSPVLRFHDKGEGIGTCAIRDSCARAIPWQLPSTFFAAIKSAAKERDELVPYMYTAAWENAVGNTGAALQRPMYWEDPTDSNLYGLDNQYLFGPDMIISPITKSSKSSKSSISKENGGRQALGTVLWTIYVPSSQRGWVDRLHGDFFTGEAVTRFFGINDVPGFVRQGAVIPMRPPRARRESSLARAIKPLSSLEFRIMPAEAFYEGRSFQGVGRVIDDDGLTLDYLKSGRSITQLEYTFLDGKFDISIGQEGSFSGCPARVTLRLSFPQLPPMQVISSSGLGSVSLKYDHQFLGPVLVAEDVNLTARPSVTLAFEASYGGALLNFVGALGRVRRARYVKHALDAYVSEGYRVTNLTSYVLAAAQMSPEFATNMGQLWQSAQEQVMSVLNEGKIPIKDPSRYEFVRRMLTSDTSIPPVVGAPIMYA